MLNICRVFPTGWKGKPPPPAENSLIPPQKTKIYSLPTKSQFPPLNKDFQVITQQKRHL